MKSNLLFNPKQRLKERYQLQQQLGNNAGRQTWLAQDLQSGEQVTVKLLAFNPQMEWDEFKLFEREAAVLKQLNHPRIPQYRDYFSLDQKIGAGLCWFGLVQDYIPGKSLQQLLNEGKRFTESQVGSIAKQVLNILIYLHGLNSPVLHRDIKPSNLILGDDKQIYLVDFGAVQDSAAVEGVTFTVVGTSGYAPLEQFWGQAVPASDLYGLGATLIHLLTGVSPADLPQRNLRIQFREQVSINSQLISWIEALTEPDLDLRLSCASQALDALETGRSIRSIRYKLETVYPFFMTKIKLKKSPEKLIIYFPGNRIEWLIETCLIILKSIPFISLFIFFLIIALCILSMVFYILTSLFNLVFPLLIYSLSLLACMILLCKKGVFFLGKMYKDISKYRPTNFGGYSVVFDAGKINCQRFDFHLHELSPPVLHRDIKPSNLILGKNNQIYLVDFGAVQDKAKAEGVTFTVVGTSGYAPPEQLWGKAVPASDLYALGATLIHLLTGIPPAELPQQRMRIKFQDKVRINPNFANWIDQLIQPATERRLSTARQAFSLLQSSFVYHPTKISRQQSINRSSDTNNGYGCGVLALLGIIGLLGLSSLAANRLSGAVGAKQSEAKQYVGSMNRAQQAYFLEEGNFTNNIPELGLGISTETTNYTYSTYATYLSAINYSVSRKSDLKSYVGGVFLGSVEETGELTTLAIFCETKDKGTNRPPAPIVENGMLQCAPGTESLDGENDQGIFIGEDWKLVDVSANYAKAGKYNQAIDTAETMTNDLIKVKALEVITTELMVAGKSKQALPIIEKIQAIALKLTDAGESEQALRVTRYIPDDSIQSKTIQAIAPYLTTSAEYEQAIQVAKTVTDYPDKAKALDAIVHRLAATGNHKRAAQIAQTIQIYYGGKDKAMAAIERYKN